MATLQKAREGHVEAQIELRHAKDELADIELALDATPPEGNNDRERKAFVAAQRVESAAWQAATAALRAAQDDADRAELALQVALDDVKADERRTRAKLADALWVIHGTPGMYSDAEAERMTLDDLAEMDAANLAALGDDYAPPF